MTSYRSSNKSPLDSAPNPSSPKNKKSWEDCGPIRKKPRIGKMAGGAAAVRTRQAFAVVNGSTPNASQTASVAGSECGAVEFTKEEVEALLNEKMKNKMRSSLKEQCDHKTDYIRRLRLCIKWFQELEGNYLEEQEKLQTMLDAVERRCNEAESFMKNKEEELNAIITELRKNYASAQEKVAKEESDKLTVTDCLAIEKEARLAAEKLQSCLSEELTKYQEELQTSNQKLSSLNDMYKRLQEYNTSLQQYNTKLQSELAAANDSLKHVEKEKAAVVENLSSVRGHNKSLQNELASSRGLQVETFKQNEALAKEVTIVRGELQQVRDDRDSQRMQLQLKTAEVEKFRMCTEISSTELDKLTLKSKQLEEKCLSQSGQVRTLQEQLAAAEKKLQMTGMSEIEVRTESEERRKVIDELRTKLEEAELKIIEGENIRKKLHNTILELKGNIRVFCRVRPLLPDDEASMEVKAISFPTSAESGGHALDVMQNGQSMSFTFDKVFTPDVSQEDVFVEISQLVQSALDGYKVCIFAYGQTGSGKTYTMMGRPGNHDQKGLIPRSLEQIFRTKQHLQLQGWKYEMQVSMLEIYNETIRDLLSTNRSDMSKADNSIGGKQYAIKHDANGNTHVSDLTVIDVRSSKEVSYLLDQAARSRSVGKTQMNEQSSRSHFVFTLKISGTNESTYQQVQGVLNLIDLAGSERLSKSGATGDRLKETQAINRSLSSLSDVIFALAKKEDHVPFRNSKLTYLLQPCLGGDSKTLMFVNVSPDPASVGESVCSLRFAARVNACEIGVPRRQTNLRSADSRMSYG
uniref:Kinesin-like protein n=1 Tax=Kalanchoe fedtschenkoi TaxID=63787 RepID=A0A7N0UX87_KALFE